MNLALPRGSRALSASGHQTSDLFEKLIEGKAHLVFLRRGWGKPSRVETIDADTVEEAREWLLAREGDERCRGIIKRTKGLNTLRGIAYNLASGLDARGFNVLPNS